MLAKGAPQLPSGDGFAFEPKWDGFRCIAAIDRDEVALYSRGRKDLGRYFPEVVALLASGVGERCVLDGELVVRTGSAGAERLDWDALSARIHPAASRIERLAAETPAQFVCFDLLALGDTDLTDQPYAERRATLVALFDRINDDPGLHLSAATQDRDLALRWFTEFEGAGLDGVVAKPLAGTYRPGERTMIKVKHARTAEAVVVGYRIHKRGHGVGSLLLGLYDEAGNLLPVGGIGALPDKLRESLVDELDPLVVRDEQGEVVDAARAPSRFSTKADDQFVPLRPELVVEVAFDQLEGMRFRHAVTLLRFRPDREASSCLIEQIDRPVAYDLGRVLDA